MHFMRNALAYAAKTQRRIVSAWIGTAFAQDDAAAARKQSREVADQARPRAAQWRDQAPQRRGWYLPERSRGHQADRRLAAGLPVLVRDLPVFREVAGDHARYFSDGGSEALAAALRDWLLEGFAPPPTGIRPLSWNDSFRQLCKGQ
jgi:hypothetical protein